MLIPILLAVSVLLFLGYTIYSIRITQVNWLGILLCLLVIAGLGFLEFRHQDSSQRLNYMAVNITNLPQVQVDCKRIEETLLDTTLKKAWRDSEQTNVVHLKYDTCDSIVNWMNNPAQINPGASYDFYLLMRTIAHVPNTIPKAASTCFAEANYVTAGTLIGATPEQAQALFNDYQANVKPNLPEEYAANC